MDLTLGPFLKNTTLKNFTIEAITHLFVLEDVESLGFQHLEQKRHL